MSVCRVSHYRPIKLDVSASGGGFALCRSWNEPSSDNNEDGRQEHGLRGNPGENGNLGCVTAENLPGTIVVGGLVDPAAFKPDMPVASPAVMTSTSKSA
jgi:hypothetical protein